MENPLHLRKIPQDFQAVRQGLPLVDNHRKPNLLSQGHLHPEGLFLNLSGNVLIVVVKADFSNGLHLFLPAQKPVFVQNRLVHLVRSIRVGAYGGVEKGVLFCQGNGIFGAFQGAAGIHHKGNALFRQAGNQSLPVAIKCPVVQMGMGVKQHGVAS